MASAVKLDSSLDSYSEAVHVCTALPHAHFVLRSRAALSHKRSWLLVMWRHCMTCSQRNFERKKECFQFQIVELISESNQFDQISITFLHFPFLFKKERKKEKAF